MMSIRYDYCKIGAEVILLPSSLFSKRRNRKTEIISNMRDLSNQKRNEKLQ